MRPRSVTPLMDTGWRRRSVLRSIRWPWKDAIIPRQASPHSAASVWRTTGRRLLPLTDRRFWRGVILGAASVVHVRRHGISPQHPGLLEPSVDEVSGIAESGCQAHESLF